MAPIVSLSVTVSRRCLLEFARRDSARAVVWLRGEHDVSTVAARSETMARAIALNDANLVVDSSEVQFMGAATVGVIIRAWNSSDFDCGLWRCDPTEVPAAHPCPGGHADLSIPAPFDTTPTAGPAGALDPSEG